ncbi:hypothetical protein COOONC_22658, partial [Cooperia oncophora]
MATHKMNFFEKMANMLGHLYRHQAAQFPRRWEILTSAVGKHELAPPKTSDWPAMSSRREEVYTVHSTKRTSKLTV